MTETLAEKFLRELDRNKRILPRYKAIGPSGTFAYRMIDAKIKEATQALWEQDAAAMLRMLPELEDTTE